MKGKWKYFMQGGWVSLNLKGPNVTWEPGLLVIDNGNLIDFGFGFFFLLLVMSETNSPTVSY